MKILDENRKEGKASFVQKNLEMFFGGLFNSSLLRFQSVNPEDEFEFESKLKFET